MLDSNVSRRQFNGLAAAAFGGLVLGTTAVQAANPQAGESLLLQEPHTCRGLNICKGKDATEKNSCAGMGQCATAKAHDCAGANACKGQGGCGATPGENSCKGMGECAVPLGKKPWMAARKNFESAMKKAGKKFGAAPKPKKS